METEPKTLDEILEGLSQGEVEFVNFQIIDQVNEPAAALDVESEPATAAATNSKQFRKVNVDDIDNFLKDQQNLNTKRKTEQDMSVFKAYLLQCGEGRQPEVIPPSELDTIISMFLLSVKRKDGSEYEPTTLRSYMGRYLKETNYPVGLMCDLQFQKCRAVLKTKQKQLKGLGKGNKPMAADELTDMELEHLYETNTLGMQSPAALLYSLWMICTMHFGMCPGKETHDLKWGDVELKTDVENGEEYIVYSQERQTKTRTGFNPHDLRKVKPRAYALPGIVNKDPVALYKKYASKRPTVMNDPNKPFFLTINRDANIESSNSKWYKNCPMGINKMYQIMKEMKVASGLETDRRLTNYSVRKRLVQKLNDSGVPPNQIVQITGHNNVNSLNNYSRLNSDQCKGISNILSTGEGNRGVPASTTICRESDATSGPNQQPFPSVGGLFTGNTTFNSTVNFHFHGSQQTMQASNSNYVISGQTHPRSESLECGSRQSKRIRVIDSDSD